MPDILQTLVPYIVGGMFFLALVLFLVALVYFRRGKRDRYWRLRRAASLTGWQLFLISLTLAFVASAVCLFSGFASLVLEGGLQASPVPVSGSPTVLVSPLITVLPTAQAAATTAMPSPSPTPQPASATPSATPTGTASATASPRPTRLVASVTLAGPTATPTATELQVWPLASNVTPPPEADLTIVAVDRAVSADLQPVNPDALLQAGITRLYFWVAYRGMVDGVAWERLLLRDGRVIQGGAYLWNGGAEGTALYFFGDAEGFTPGEYEIRLAFSGVTVESKTLRIQ